MKITNKKDFITGIVCVVLSAWIIWLSMQLPAATYEGDPGPKMFPLIGGILIGICGIILMVKQGPAGPAYLTKAQWIAAGKIFGIYILCTLLMYVFGWTVGMFLTLFGLTFVLSKVSMPDATIKKRLITSLIWAVCCGAGIYLAYKVGLKARVPKGLLNNLYKQIF